MSGSEHERYNGAPVEGPAGGVVGRSEKEEELDEDVDLAALEEALGHRFADQRLLVSAITHRSYSHENADDPHSDNESLEFLGDAVLAFLIADRVFREFPGLDEGRLSRHKARLENVRTLADVARRLDLGRFLRVGRGVRRSLGVRNDRMLGSLLEALVAALYLDGGIDVARTFADRALGESLAELDAENPVVDFKTELQEFTQGEGLGSPSYRVIEESGRDHEKEFVVVVQIEGRDYGRGTGSSKRAAHQVAARQALEVLKEETED